MLAIAHLALSRSQTCLLSVALLCAAQAARPLDPPIREQEVAPKDAEPFLPAMEYTSKPVESWISDFEESGGGSSEALWCVFYSDDRSDLVVGFLRAQLSKRGPLFRELDAILDHWDAEHECLSFEDYWDPEMSDYGAVTQPSQVYPPITFANAVAAQSTGDLVELLDSPDLEQRVHAAMILVSRQEFVPEATRAIVHVIYESGEGWGDSYWHWNTWGGARGKPAAQALPYALTFGGTAAERGLADLLADPGEPLEVKRFVLDKMHPAPRAYPALRDSIALPRALAGLARGGPLEASARRELFRMCAVEGHGAWMDPTGEVWPHVYAESEPLEAPQLEPLLGAVAVRVLAEGEPVGDHPPVLAIQELVLRSRIVLDLVRPELIRRAGTETSQGREALRLLCHAGDRSAEVRDLVLRAYTEVDAADSGALSRLPCWRHEDDETRAAFEALFDAATAKESLHRQIVSGGFMEDPESHVAEAYSAYLDQSGITKWVTLDLGGFAGPTQVQPGDSKITKVSKYGIAARWKLARGLDPSEEQERLWQVLEAGFPEGGTAPLDYYSRAITLIDELDLDRPRLVEWGVGMLQDFWATFGNHKSAVARALMDSDLSRRQQALLCRMDVDEDIGEFDSLLARQGEASIERVVDVRRVAYASWGLRDVLQITRLSGLDEEFLVRAMDNGAARHREAALETVLEFSLDTPRLKAACMRRLSDCDEPTQQLAHELQNSRGW